MTPQSECHLREMLEELDVENLPEISHFLRLLKNLAIKTKHVLLFEAIVGSITMLAPKAASSFLPEHRIELYASGIRKLKDLKRLTEMMTAFNDGTTLQLLKILELAQIQPEEIKITIQRFGLNKNFILEDVHRLLADEETDIEVARQSGQVLKVLLEAGYQFDDLTARIRGLPEALEKSFHKEDIFGYLIEILITGNLVAQNLNYLTASVLMNILMKAFTEFHDVVVLGKIWRAVWLLLTPNMKLPIIKPLLELFSTLHGQVMMAEVFELTENGQTCCHDLPIAKLSIILQTRKDGQKIYPLLDYFKYEAFVGISIEKLEKPDHPSFSLFARFHVIVLKNAWDQMFKQLNADKKQTFPFSMNFVIDQVHSLAAKLLKLIPQRKYNLLQARDIAVSLMELLHQFYFRPLEIENGTKTLLVKYPKISTHQFEQLIDFIEFYVFKLDTGLNQNFYNIDLQSEILWSFSDLIRNRSLLPNFKSVFKLIRHYRDDHKHYGLLKHILIAVIDRHALKNIIAHTIIDFVQNSDIAAFSLFIDDFHDFLTIAGIFSDEILINFKVEVSLKVMELSKRKAFRRNEALKLSSFLTKF